MAQYRYIAYDSGGREQRGIVDSPSQNRALEMLGERGLTVVDVKETSEGGRQSRRLRRMSLENHALFSRSLASYLKAGLPLTEALKLLGKQEHKKDLSAVYGYLLQSVQEGRKLGVALREMGIFQSNLVSMVESGESGGALVEVLEQAEELYRMEVSLKRRVQVALTYPSIMVMVGIGVVSFLLAYVVPKISALFADLDQVLPLPTRLLIAVSSFIRTLAVPLLIILLIVLLLVRKGRLKIKLPFFRKLNERITISIVASNLASMLNSGISLVKALEMASKMDGNSKRWLDVARMVKEGSRFEKALEKEGSFADDMIYFVRVGEMGGDLSGALKQVADNYWEIAQGQMDRIASMIEPVMVIVMGVVVGFIVVSILLPIFDISSFVK